MRALRRWLVVAGAWAVAASAIGLIALFTAGEDDASELDAASADEVSELSNRLDRLDERIGTLSSQREGLSSEVQDNSRRLEELEGNLSNTRAQSRENADTIQAVEQDATELEDRIAELEAGDGSGPGAGGQGGGAGGEQSP